MRETLLLLKIRKRRCSWNTPGRLRYSLLQRSELEKKTQKDCTTRAILCGDATTKKPVSVVPYTVDTRIVPGRNADRDCGACKARDGAGAGTASCAAAPLHTVSRTGRPGLSAGDPDLGNDSCDRTYSQAHKRTADCAWRRK